MIFTREAVPQNYTAEEVCKWLEEKFQKEKLCAIGQIHDYFIFIKFEAFCAAFSYVQNKLEERERCQS